MAATDEQIAAAWASYVGVLQDRRSVVKWKKIPATMQEAVTETHRQTYPDEYDAMVAAVHAVCK